MIKTACRSWSVTAFEMEFTVTSVAQTQDGCNLTLESVEPLKPGTYKTTLGAVNSGQVEKSSQTPPPTIGV